jgi:phosphoglycerate dehydrogenase-like enzyme
MTNDRDAVRLVVVDARSQAPVWTLTPAAEQRLREAVPEGWRMHVVRAPTVSDGDGSDAPSDEAREAIAEAEVYFGFGLAPALLRAAPRLRWVQSAAAGVRGALTPEFRARDILLTNAAGIHAEPMGDYVLGGVLHFLRGLDVAVERQRAATWDRGAWVDPAAAPMPAMARELSECRVLVIGAGGIGQAVARRFTALGAECTAVRRRPELGTPPGFATVVGQDAIDAELPRHDVVVLSAPATDATEGLLDARRLGLLRPEAIVVNVARGTLIDEAALAEALTARRIRGAVLDVFAEEPLPADSPLWRLPNALVTPHVSGVSPARFWDRMGALFLENWERYRGGESLRNLVDVSAGY